jgi:hypothetical protein
MRRGRRGKFLPRDFTIHQPSNGGHDVASDYLRQRKQAADEEDPMEDP